MQKIEVAALAHDRDRILSLLTDEGTVELSPLVDEAALRDQGDDADLRAVRLLRTRLADALKIIDRRFPPAETSMFTIRDKISRAVYDAVLAAEDELVEALGRFEDVSARENDLRNTLGQLKSQQNWLSAWRGLPVDFAEKGTESTVVTYGVAGDDALLKELKEKLTEEAHKTALIVLKEDGRNKLMAVVARRHDAARVKMQLGAADFHPLPPMTHEGSPDTVYRFLETDIAALERQLLEMESKQAAFANERQRLKILYDALGERETRLLAALELGQTDRTVYFSGWIPERKARRTEKRLTEAGAAVNLRDPLENEAFPVLLVNNRFVTAFESVLTLFGAPNNAESDPLPAMAPFYMLIFGMMLSDVGYGLLLVLACAYLLFRVKVEGGMRAMSQMLLVSGFASIIWGFMFGGFFGDLITVLSEGRVSFPVLLFDPMTDPMKLLIFSMLFGVVHLYVGMAMKIVNAGRFGNIWDGLWETVPWYMIITGAVLLLAGAAGAVSGDLAGTLGQIGQWMLIGGAVLVIAGAIRAKKHPVKGFFSGLLGLYNVTGWLSDILSYSRILALVLATSVIAIVFNSIAGMMLGLPVPFNYVLFAVIAIPTHLLNLALSSLSAYVHASRLQYIEMFGKFFDGGGRYYKPLKKDMKYISVLDASPAEAADDDL